MNKWLDDIKQLDPKNPGAWPWPFKFAAMVITFVAVMFGFYVVLFQGQIDELESARKGEEDRKASYLEKKKLAVNLEEYKKQRTEIEANFSNLLKQLPNKSEVDALVVDINQAGLGRGLQIDLFKSAPTETFTEFYAERVINLKVVGNYHDMGAFTSDVAKLPRIVLLNDLKIDAGKDGGPLTMEAVAKTYRYLDPEEIAAQKKAAKDANKAGAKEAPKPKAGGHG